MYTESARGALPLWGVAAVKQHNQKDSGEECVVQNRNVWPLLAPWRVLSVIIVVVHTSRDSTRPMHLHRWDFVAGGQCVVCGVCCGVYAWSCKSWTCLPVRFALELSICV